MPIMGRNQRTRPSSCLLRGEAEASTTRLLRSWFSVGMSSGSNGGGPGALRGDRIASGGAFAGALTGVGPLLRDSSYDGGGSEGGMAGSSRATATAR